MAESTRTEVLGKVKRITAKALHKQLDKINDQSRFIDDLGADSLDFVELIMFAEEEFGIEIPDRDAEQIESIAGAADLILRLQTDRARMRASE